MPQDSGKMMIMMIESSLARITAYAAKNRIKTTLEAENMARNESMARGSIDGEMANVLKLPVENSENKEIVASLDNGCVEDVSIEQKDLKEDAIEPEDLRLDCIYDDGPLGFEKPVAEFVETMEAQDSLEELDLGDSSKKRPTYISSLTNLELKQEMISLLQEYKDCFAWDYDKMPGLSRELVELKLPIRQDKKPLKQTPRRFAPYVVIKTKGFFVASSLELPGMWNGWLILSL